MKIKGIGVKLTISIVMLLLLTCVMLGTLSYFSSARALTEQAEIDLEWKAEDVGHYIEEFFKRTYIEVESIAEQSAVQSMDLKTQFAYLNKRIEKSEDYIGFGIVTPDGISYYSDGTTADLSDRDYIIEAFKGNTAMSDIIISRVTNEPVIMIATPIETVTNEKALLLARMDGYFLSSVIETITVGETGYALIVNEEGTIQAHQNRENVKNQVNFLTQAKETGEMTGEATAIEEMLNNEEGFYDFTHSNGNDQLLGFHSLNNGWTIAVTAIKHEMLAGLSDMKKGLIYSTMFSVFIGLFFAIFVTRSISKPITEVVRISEYLSEGDFTQEIPEKHRKRLDELGSLARSLTRTVTNMKTMIAQVNKNATNVSEASCDLMSDVNAVTSVTKGIASAIEEVERGSNIQSTMADESATAMEQMALGVQHVAEVASTVTEHTQFIETKVREGHEAVNDSIHQMKAIQGGTEIELQVIRKLDHESKEIGLISKMITDISEQTNLLALNASIEAARAGEAGKGFAVVAGEVRKLSEQTADSAAQINKLIEKVQAYTGEAVRAAELSEDTVEQGLQYIYILESRFMEIVQAVEQITSEIGQLSQSAQEMSANTEEVSASMEEMSASANAAAVYVEEVTDATDSQLKTVDEMSRQANELSEMAAELQQAVRQFKI
ncbi:methyl-accepting chemotaxis protein [Solibacillus sp. CAU 1738]|uniref:methyl-accepting chemotaxis protein n=1 Tax=Solibacillus sp. CAU 1738 TaxID=3140363 RepID=UPI0032601A96